MRFAYIVWGRVNAQSSGTIEATDEREAQQLLLKREFTSFETMGRFQPSDVLRLTPENWQPLTDSEAWTRQQEHSARYAAQVATDIEERKDPT